MLRCFDDSVLYFKVASKTNSVATRKVRLVSPPSNVALLFTSLLTYIPDISPFRNGWMLLKPIPPLALVTTQKKGLLMLQMVMS